MFIDTTNIYLCYFMEWVDSLEFYSGIFSDRKLKAYIFKKILN